jgi:hypothetical protein
MGSNNTAETYYRIGRAKQRSDHNLILSIVSPHLMANTNIFYQVTTSMSGGHNCSYDSIFTVLCRGQSTILDTESMICKLETVL